MSFSLASSQARALAQARSAALVNDYRNFLSLLYLALLLSALERNKRANTANRLADRTGAIFDLSDRKTQSLDTAAYAHAPQEIPCSKPTLRVWGTLR